MDISKPTIIIDTREHNPWSFPDYPCTRRALSTGDYSLENFDSLPDGICIERKNLNDYVQTIIQPARRVLFCAELERMQKMKFGIVIVECSYTEILSHKYKSEVKPFSIIGMEIYLSLKYKIPIVLAGDRANARMLAEKYLISFWKANKNPEKENENEIKTEKQNNNNHEIKDI